MSTYADRFNLRNPAVLNGNGIASALDGLCASGSAVSQFQGSPLSTTSGAPTSIVGGPQISLSLQAGQIVFLCGSISASNSGLNTIDLWIFVDGVAATNSITVLNTVSAVSGLNVVVSNSTIYTASAGTHLFEFNWATAAGTAYSSRQNLTAVVLRNS